MPDRVSNDRLRELLIKHEGLKLRAYLCSAGKTTIGVGRNLDDVGITETEARLLLSNDIDRVLREAVDNFPWFKSLSLVRQDVVLSILFNLGLGRFKEFKKFISALITGNFNAAADEMLASKWSSQVGRRAVELAQMMRLDRYI